MAEALGPSRSRVAVSVVVRIERLIAKHGSGVLDLCAIIAADCPRMRNPATSIYERCGVHVPELPRWF